MKKLELLTSQTELYEHWLLCTHNYDSCYSYSWFYSIKKN